MEKKCWTVFTEKDTEVFSHTISTLTAALKYKLKQRYILKFNLVGEPLEALINH